MARRYQPENRSDDEIISAIKKLAEVKGGVPTYHELVASSKAGKYLCPGTIVRRIGKLTDLKNTLLN